MGQQVNFYLIPSDLRAAEDRVRKCGEYLVLLNRSSEAKPRIVSGLDFEEGGKKWLFFYLVRPEDLASIQMRHVSKHNYWVLDGLRSPTVEFISCFSDGARIRRGRVYFQPGFYAETREWVTKSVEFLQWAKRVLVNVKKTLHRDPTLGVYVGPDTQAWVEHKGGKLLKPCE